MLFLGAALVDVGDMEVVVVAVVGIPVVVDGGLYDVVTVSNVNKLRTVTRTG